MNTVIAHKDDNMEHFADNLTNVMKQVAELAKYRNVTPIPEVTEPDSQGRDTTAMSALTPNDRALRDQINSETRIEQLKIDFDEKLRLLKRQFNIDSDEVRKAVLKRVDDLTATRVTDSENEIIRLDVKTQRVEETIGGQVTKLAANIDQVNEIQRQVLETIDKRVEEIEMTRDNEKT